MIRINPQWKNTRLFSQFDRVHLNYQPNTNDSMTTLPTKHHCLQILLLESSGSVTHQEGALRFARIVSPWTNLWNDMWRTILRLDSHFDLSWFVSICSCDSLDVGKFCWSRTTTYHFWFLFGLQATWPAQTNILETSNKPLRTGFGLQYNSKPLRSNHEK